MHLVQLYRIRSEMLEEGIGCLVSKKEAILTIDMELSLKKKNKNLYAYPMYVFGKLNWPDEKNALLHSKELFELRF